MLRKKGKCLIQLVEVGTKLEANGCFRAKIDDGQSGQRRETPRQYDGL